MVAITGSLLISSLPTFKPTNLVNCVGWYDAADTSPLNIVQSSNSVSQWSDKSGNAYNSTWGTAANQPTTNVLTQNGKNVISFDGNDVLSLPSALNSIANASNTLFIVANTSINSTQQRAIVGLESGSLRWGFAYSSSGTDRVTFINNNTSGGVNMSGVNKAQMNIFTGTFDSSGPTMGISVNNSVATTGVGALENGITSVAISPGGAFALTGSIAEIIIYNRLLSAGEINQVNRYLSYKWGITIS